MDKTHLRNSATSTAPTLPDLSWGLCDVGSTVTLWSGSSPLTRGLPPRPAVWPARLRIIPARAGFTSRHRPPESGPGDHPRSREVYGERPDRGTGRLGSSPLARGLLTINPPARRRLRIIPARAGFTSADIVTGMCLEDHPRSRGVYTVHVLGADGKGGSSPLARGLRSTTSITLPPSADHPRSRGVYPTIGTRRMLEQGSSPLARGLPGGRTSYASTRRIIPARAGFTSLEASCSGVKADHPRSRGVYPSSAYRITSEAGSSPLARGLPRRRAGDGRRGRIIPARAGFTKKVVIVEGRGLDHPRSRGVYQDGLGDG